MTEPYTALALNNVSTASVTVTSHVHVLGTRSTVPFAPRWLGYGTTQNASSEITQPSQEITPTERQRGVQSS